MSVMTNETTSYAYKIYTTTSIICAICKTFIYHILIVRASHLDGKDRCYAECMTTKAALLLFRDSLGQKKGGATFVRANNKPYYVFPRGKQEPGETIEEALQRDLQE